MKRITDHLYQSEPEHPFGNEVTTCAYLLRRPDGNLLMFSSSTLRRDEAQIRELGGMLVPGLFIGATARAAVEAPAFKHQIEEVVERLQRGERH